LGEREKGRSRARRGRGSERGTIAMRRVAIYKNINEEQLVSTSEAVRFGLLHDFVFGGKKLSTK